MAAAGFRAAAIALALAGCTSVVVDARTLAGTDWHVVAIDGHPTPASDRFRMSFETNRFSARFGCNSGGGSYRIERGLIVPGPVISTQMACASATDGPDPMVFEHQGFAVAGEPMQMHWQAGNRLTLRNGAGSIDLRMIH